MATPSMTQVFKPRESLEASSDVGHPPEGPGLQADRDVSSPPQGKGLEPGQDVDWLAQSPLDLYSPERWSKDPDPPGLMVVGGAP